MIIENIPFQPARINISKNDTLRIKVTNRCPFQCNFCHHEGSNKSLDIIIDEYLIRALKRFYEDMKLTQVHLTGGEPTSYPFCLNLIRELKLIGFKVKMTSNGQFTPAFLKRLKNAGLDGINFSIHTLNPIKLGIIQNPDKNYEWGLKALYRQLKNLKAAKELSLEVKINTVVQNDSDIIDIISFCRSEGVELRILDDLNPESLSIKRIIEILTSIKATINGINLTDKTSGYSCNIVSKDGFEFRVKAIRKNTLRTLCGNCNIRDMCKEWFYGVRIEQVSGKALVRLCLHRQDYPAIQTFEEFFKSKQFIELSEI